jgi:hypothetical protein
MTRSRKGKARRHCARCKNEATIQVKGAWLCTKHFEMGLDILMSAIFGKRR